MDCTVKGSAYHKECQPVCNVDQDIPVLTSIDYETACDMCTVISASGNLEDHVTHDIIQTVHTVASACPCPGCPGKAMPVTILCYSRYIAD